MDNTQIDNVDLDLDKLVVPSKRVRLNGEIILVYAADVQSLFKLMRFKSTLGNVDKMTEEDASKVFEEFRTLLETIIPSLKDKHITFDQLFKLMDLVIKMAVPNSLDEMEAKGIKLDPEQKKILLDSLEKLPDSSDSTQDTPSVAS